MRWHLGIACIAFGLAVLAHFSGAALAQEKKEKAKDPLEGKRGKTLGKLENKGKDFIEVRADGEEKARKYVPEWRAYKPAPGGFDKEMLKTIAELKVGSRVEVDWVFHERFRALDVKVLRAPD